MLVTDALLGHGNVQTNTHRVCNGNNISGDYFACIAKHNL